MERKEFVMMLVMFACLITAGYFAGSYYPIQEDQCQTTAIMTCLYANNLTNAINMQSDLLEKTYPLNYSRLKYLNCDLLRKR